MAKHDVISPLPGVFYRRPAPEAPEFVTEGQTVASGQVIGLIEVMKQFSELTTDTAGILVGFSTADADTVEPGQVIAVIETA